MPYLLKWWCTISCYKSILFALYFCTCFISVDAEAAETSETDVVLYTEQFPPYNFELNGTLKGINYELVKMMCDRANINCRFELRPWSRAYKAAQVKIYSGVFSTSRYDSRESLFHWVGPLVSAENYFYRLKSRTDIVISKSEDLLQYSVGAQRNDVYVDVLRKTGFIEGETLLIHSKKYGAVKHFNANQIDLIIASPLTLDYQDGLEKSLIEPVWPLAVSKVGGNYLAINPETDTEVTARLQKALNELKTKGAIEQLIEKYSNCNDILNSQL